MKKLKVFAAFGLASALLLTGCGGEKNAGAEEYTVGFSQFAEHRSLDNCRKGFLQGLKEEGIEEGKNLKIEVKNAASDMGVAPQIAASFVSKNVDMICAIATPSAQAAYNAAMDTDIPVIYTAVNNPVTASLADKDGKPVGNITGTSDRLPVEKQLQKIRQILPDAEKIGILYTTSEVNSVSTIEDYKKMAGQYGFELVVKGITTTADIPLATDDLLNQVDCITNITDNTVVNSLATILDKAYAKKIPVFGSEIEQVKLGCLAAEGLDYVELGRKTGKMAAAVLKGEADIKEMKFETITDSGFYLNTAAAEKLGIVIPEELVKDAVETYDVISSK